MFKKAYFGKPYLTRDGRTALYLKNATVDGTMNFHILILSDGTQVVVFDDGRIIRDQQDSPRDIVKSTVLEGVDLVEKALGEAIKRNNVLSQKMTPDQEFWYQEGYCDGYEEFQKESQIR